MTQPSPDLRRQFRLPPAEEDALDRVGVGWEAIEEGWRRWVLVHGVPLPESCAANRIDLAIDFPPDYPDAPADSLTKEDL